jgi:Mn2+/Fe2+ NRAMP family transporter
MPEPDLQYPEPTPDLQQGLRWRALKYFGAGAIIASVTIGSGETLFASRGGAMFGYTLLWCFVAGTLMKGVQVYTAARYMTLTEIRTQLAGAHHRAGSTALL